MGNSFVNRRDLDEIKSENELLKIKIMLELGADFDSPYSKLPDDPLLENLFLKSMIDFHNAEENREMITVFEKLGSPKQYLPLTDIPEEKIEESWRALKNHLLKNRIEVIASNPKITSANLYKFTTDEIFNKKIEAVDLNGKINSFIYDIFHPDYEYENSCIALDYCIIPILLNQPELMLYSLTNHPLQINQYKFAKNELLVKCIEHLHKKYTSLEIVDVYNDLCVIENDQCCVSGTFIISCFIDQLPKMIEEKWEVFFERTQKKGWLTKKINFYNLEF